MTMQASTTSESLTIFTCKESGKNQTYHRFWCRWGWSFRLSLPFSKQSNITRKNDVILADTGCPELSVSTAFRRLWRLPHNVSLQAFIKDPKNVEFPLIPFYDNDGSRARHWIAGYFRQEMKRVLKQHLHTCDAHLITLHSWRVGRTIELMRSIEQHNMQGKISIDAVVALGRWTGIRSLDPYLEHHVYELMVMATVTPALITPTFVTVACLKCCAYFYISKNASFLK